MKKKNKCFSAKLKKTIESSRSIDNPPSLISTNNVCMSNLKPSVLKTISRRRLSIGFTFPIYNKVIRIFRRQQNGKSNLMSSFLINS
ncbi:hypothetical protein BRARA_I02741 [Brassica rapa]|uniref:Uncharacterized protein n=1 Tax=Brassica campestris TaxID=3711 RepID=A0A397Y329_BRACM|nr:hypothetical protein BRARA_I02741 [Brassica rapa]